MEESAKRLEITVLPLSSAGRITSETICAREARKRRSSARTSMPLVFLDMRSVRICSPSAVPPGSWVYTKWGYSCLRRSTNVDLPEPSPPSKTMNFPRMPHSTPHKNSQQSILRRDNRFRRVWYGACIVKLLADNVVRVRFIEEFFAVFEQVHIPDTRLNHRIPARFAAPPMAPEVEVGADGFVTAL